MSSIRSSTIGRSPEMPCAQSADCARRRRGGWRRTTGAATDRRRARGRRDAGRGSPRPRSMPRWRSCTCACVQASVAARSKAVGVVVLVDQVEHARRATTRRPSRTRRAPSRPAGCARGGAARRSDRARCRRCWTAAGRPSPRSALADLAAAAEEARAVGLDTPARRPPRLRRRRGAPPRSRGSPGERRRRVARSAPSSGEILGLHEQLREGRMRGVGGGRREHELGVGGDLDLARRGCPLFVSDTRRTSASSSGETTTSSVVVSVPSRPDELGAVLGERRPRSCRARRRSAGSRRTTRRRSATSRRKT